MIVAGFGFRTGADIAALRDALMQAQSGCPPITAMATPADKAPLATDLAALLNLPLIAVSAITLQTVPTHTLSQASLEARGTGSVAEACALAAAGPGARLLTPRHISRDRMATCAIAQGSLA